MNTTPSESRALVLTELERIPDEWLPAFLKIARAFREGVAMPAPEESFRQGWSEASAGEARPVSELWDGIDAE
jgi:hypothetical protein